MKTLEYYASNGTHMVFQNYTIDENGIIADVRMKNVATRHENANMYNTVNVCYGGKRYCILVGRAIASTFLGKPPTPDHTADHVDRDSLNDVLTNIRWASKSEQIKNRVMPSKNESAFIVKRYGIEHTVKGWVNELRDETNPHGGKYTTDVIKYYAQKQKHGFMYKTYPNFRREVWKRIQCSENKAGEWLISSMSRVKYKTKYAEHVLTANQLYKRNGYPMVRLNGKLFSCHDLSFMTFRPKEYSTKAKDELILHKSDDKLDFGPFRLRFGTRSDNGNDAHENGKYDDTKTSRKPIISYINGKFEQEHSSTCAAARYLQKNGYPKAAASNVFFALRNGVIRYNRTWKRRVIE